MPLPRYERELEERATPGFKRAFLLLWCVGILLGIALGIVWILVTSLTASARS